MRNKVFAGAGFAAAGTLAFDTVPKSEKLLKSISKTALLKKVAAGFTIALLSSALSIFAMLKLINPEGTKPFHPKENIVLIQSPAPVHSVPVMENTKTSDQSNFINILPFVDNKGEYSRNKL